MHSFTMLTPILKPPFLSVLDSPRLTWTDHESDGDRLDQLLSLIDEAEGTLSNDLVRLWVLKALATRARAASTLASDSEAIGLASGCEARTHVAGGDPSWVLDSSSALDDGTMH